MNKIDPRACHGPDPELWFTLRDRESAKLICRACPVTIPCRDMARSEGIPAGVFGGEDEFERDRWWRSSGGRPTHFLDVLDSLLGARSPNSPEKIT